MFQYVTDLTWDCPPYHCGSPAPCSVLWKGWCSVQLVFVSCQRSSVTGPFEVACDLEPANLFHLLSQFDDSGWEGIVGWNFENLGKHLPVG